MLSFISLPLAYIIGSIPFGLLVVRLTTGQDVRVIESGRTGGTNVMRAAGTLAGLSTAGLDILKGAMAVWISQHLAADMVWLNAASGFLAVVGHNYSVFLIEKDQNGKLHLRGGAGGATTLGAAIGLWVNSWMYILPMALIFYLVVGYASLTTISIAVSAMGVFLYRAVRGANPWVFAVFGLAVVIVVVIALQPNLQRLKEGTERRVQLLKRIFKKQSSNLP